MRVLFVCALCMVLFVFRWPVCVSCVFCYIVICLCVTSIFLSFFFERGVGAGVSFCWFVSFELCLYVCVVCSVL